MTDLLACLNAPGMDACRDLVRAMGREFAARDAEITRLRAAGEAALYQLVIINGTWAAAKSDWPGGWRIDTSEAIAALKAVLPVPAKESDHG